ncbi:MAG: hypothetical protein K9M07_00720 [Simkaniaceae bacterium]|nr:hypothetical protein [Simkaniaceae bacterium]
MRQRDKDLLRIRLPFDCPDTIKREYDLYTQSIEAALSNMIPPSVLEKAPDPQDKQAVTIFFNKVKDQLPLISSSFSLTSPYVISLKFLAYSEYTHGMGRFISEAVSRWLVLGKQLPLISVSSMAFEFVRYPKISFFFHEVLVRIDSEKDFEMAKTNCDPLLRQIKLNILSVQYARKIVDQKNLTLDQKKIIIQENIASLLGRPKQNIDETIFDQTHQFLIKILAEEKVEEIKEQIAPLLEHRPQIFERGVFNELNESLTLFNDHFLALRTSKHLTRIIAYLYLFKKMISNLTILHPNLRHLSFKVLKTHLLNDQKNCPIIGLVISLNLLRENELFEERHLIKSVEAIVSNIKKVSGSYAEMRKSGSVRNLYIEFEKEGCLPFSPHEIGLIKQRLPSEIKLRIETIINPIFMQKNEEEVMRNILTLCNQLKYVHDIPQANISFHKQTDQTLSFIVVLARILRPGDQPIKNLLSKYLHHMRIENYELKSMGLLRKRYMKEANVFEVYLDKKHFLREDFSLDLYEARRVVYDGITKVIGEIRDYNGGMISKQNEALQELTKLLAQDNIQNDFLIENYFYSLMPVYMQSVLPPRILKKQFIMLLQATEHDYTHQPYFMQMQIVDNYFILMLGSMNPSFKEVIKDSIERAQFDSSSLTSSAISPHDIFCFGYLYQYDTPKDYENLLISMTEGIKSWQKTQIINQTFDPVAAHL